MSLPRIPMPQLTKTVSSMSSHPNSMPTLSSHANPMPSHTSLPSSSTISSTRVVNSLTASGVVIKEEPEEKPNISMMTNFVAVSNPVKMEHPSYISSSISGSSSRPSSLSNTSPGSILSIPPTYPPASLGLPPDHPPSPTPAQAASCPSLMRGLGLAVVQPHTPKKGGQMIHWQQS